jgi:hypothetical protein
MPNTVEALFIRSKAERAAEHSRHGREKILKIGSRFEFHNI